MIPADLEAHTRPLTEVEQTAVLDRTRELQPGQRVGQFRLIRALGHGGMGQVWLAEQQEPLVRQVALKLQKQRLSGGIAEAYFQVERQALAQLVHPYIGQIYDAGTLPDGALYFAMEYVDGLTLDRFVSRRKLDVDATVGLLVRICQGAQHAHQRGLIHRDLKPGNILVLEVGGQAIPKIIDFGVAIGIDPRSGVALTQRRAGTRAYMAPEQNLPTADGIDVRADVFALGTLLTECLCLSLGITMDLLGSERMRSLLASASAMDHGTNAVLSSVPGARAAKRIPAELRAIAIKAMAVDRNQRYESAAALADDLERWRQARPVRAMGSGRWYAVRCFVRRYRVVTAAGVLIMLALVGGLIMAWYGLQQAQAARDLAEERRAKAERLIGYMLGDFAEKLRQLGKLELLDGVSSEAMKYLGSQSFAANNQSANGGAYFRAQAMRTLGEVQSARGQYADAARIFGDAELVLAQAPSDEVRPQDLLLERGTLAYWRGYVDYKQGNLSAAERYWLGYAQYAAQLKPLTGDSGVGLLESSYAHSNLGTLLFEKGDSAGAARAFMDSIAEKKEYLAQKPEDMQALDALSNNYSWLGRVQESAAQLQQSLRSYRKQLELTQQVRTQIPDSSRSKFSEALAHFWVASSALNVGNVDEAIGHYGQAVSMLAELQDLDSGQVSWRDALVQARLDLCWAQYLQNPDVLPIEELTELLGMVEARAVADPGSRKLLRQAARIKLRLMMVKPAPGARAALSVALAQHAQVLRAEPAEVEDRRLGMLIAIELSAAGAPLATEPSAIVAEIVALGDRLPFQDLELLGRAARLTGDLARYQQAQARLDEIGYHHPDYVRFLVTTAGGK